MDQFTWIHVSDLYCGDPTADAAWDSLQDVLAADLTQTAERRGAPDGVLITGDLTATGEASEFARVAERLEWFDAVFGRELPVVAVPGNHDLRRPADPTMVGWLYSNDPLGEMGRDQAFERDHHYRSVLHDLFGPWQDFFDQTLRRRSPGMEPGALPGDVRVTLDKHGLRLGLIGVNTAWRHFCDLPTEGHISVHPEQLRHLLPNGGAPFAREHHLALGLQHHPPEWFAPGQEWPDEGLHGVLVGHRPSQHPGVHGGESLLRMGDETSRTCGYAWGGFDVRGGEVRAYAWPRLLATDGQRFVGPDEVSPFSVHEGPATAPAASDWDVFIAYPTPERESALALYNLLRPHCRAFLDVHDIAPAARWNQVLPTAMRGATVVVVLLSRRADLAHYLLDEITLAIGQMRTGTKVILPVLLEPLRELPYGLNNIQAMGPGVSMAEVARAARTQLGAPDRAPEVAVRHDAVQPYLDYAARRYETLRVPAFRDRIKITLKLDDAFVTLQARMTGPTAGEQLPGRLMPEGLERLQSEVVDLPQALARMAPRDCHGLAVLGDPGSGKTTLLKHLFREVYTHGSAHVGLPDQLTPVLLRLVDVDEAVLEPDGLATLLTRTLDAAKFSAAGAALVANRRPMLFLLDGLDEVPQLSWRRKVSEWLDDECARWPGSRFVVTCRYAAWEYATRLSTAFAEVDLQWLSEAQVTEFVHRWYRAVVTQQGRSADEARARADALLEGLLDPARQAQHSLRALTQNPLLLSTLCLVHHDDVKLPDRRVDLYDRCVTLLLETWPRAAARAACGQGRGSAGGAAAACVGDAGGGGSRAGGGARDRGHRGAAGRGPGPRHGAGRVLAAGAGARGPARRAHGRHLRVPAPHVPGVPGGVSCPGAVSGGAPGQLPG